MSEYKKIKDEIKKAEREKSDAIQAQEKKLEKFVKNQTFTGKELLDMESAIDKGYHGMGGSGVNLSYLLDRILQYREEEEE